MSELEIRRTRTTDAAAISALIRRCLREVNLKDYDPELIEGMCRHFDAETVRRLGEEREMFVAVDGGQVIATVSRLRNLVFTLFVNPDYSGRRVGSALMAHIEGRAREAGYAFMETGASVSARDFYRRLGFIDVRETTTDEAGLNYILRKALAPMPADALLAAPLPA